MKLLGGLLIFFAGYVWCDSMPGVATPAAIGELEEIVVTAPRHIETADSVGMLPGIVVYGTRYNTSYESYRARYLSLTNDMSKYAAGALLFIFVLTVISIAWTKRVVIIHEHVRHNSKKKNALHDYYMRCQKKKVESKVG